MKPDVFFETLTPVHRPLVTWYLRRSHRVLVYDFTCRLKTQPWLARLINAGRVERIYIHPLSRADHEAIRATEWLYPRLEAQPLTRRLAEVFGARETETVLKKALLEALFPYCFVRDDLERRVEGGEVILVPDTYLSSEHALAEWPERRGVLARVRIPAAARRWSEASGWVTRWLYAQRLSASALCTHLSGRVRSGDWEEGRRAAFDHVYAIDQPFQTKFEGGRRFDFFIDGEVMTRKNTAFLVSPGAEGPWMAEARAAGFEVIRRADYLGLGPAATGDAPPRRSMRQLIARSIASPGAPAWLRTAAATAILTTLSDVPLLERVTFVNYVYTNQDTVYQAWRNALIRRFGGQTWYFTLAIGGGYIYTDGPEADHRFWAYQNADHFVTAGRQLVEYHRRHRQRVRCYHAVGNIWSELVLKVERRVGRDALRRQWFGDRVGGGKVVSWFDTSFVEADTSPSTYGEAIAWYGDIERFLEEFDKVFVVVKPSKDEWYFVDESTQWAHPLGRPLMEIWARLRAHPRVHFAGHEGDPTSIIAGSDLTITFCFSSVTADALGAARRAIWYEPDHRWGNALFSRAPGLVAHGYAELSRRARALLYEVTESEDAAYLDRHVRGLVEEYLDGGGLTRFRALLTASAGRGVDQ